MASKENSLLKNDKPVLEICLIIGDSCGGGCDGCGGCDGDVYDCNSGWCRCIFFHGCSAGCGGGVDEMAGVEMAYKTMKDNRGTKAVVFAFGRVGVGIGSGVGGSRGDCGQAELELLML
ncbi:Hypothetical predicted protein [Octopus vulgaris]|uniref:Uncharacterized protein n=1 Tax=Octopus vulgaris TaxID=6645 RepID=A0AA36AZC2_OCTVU|nr:Hypothetical predicted protein [Octopus vulgaris]